jgi:hypothetical protein
MSPECGGRSDRGAPERGRLTFQSHAGLERFLQHGKPHTGDLPRTLLPQVGGQGLGPRPNLVESLERWGCQGDGTEGVESPIGLHAPRLVP